MRVRSLYFHAVVALIAMTSPATAADDTPWVDVVVTTNLDTGAHARRYVQAMSQSVALALEGLDPVTYDNDDDVPARKPAEGAARFRLVVEHRGTIVLGRVQRVANGFRFVDGAIEGNVIRRTIDKAHWDSIWGMTASHRGTVAFKLLAWDGRSYKTLASWNANIRNADPEAGTGSVTVARVSQATADKYDPNPRCPITEAEAREAGLAKLMPDSLALDVLAGLVEGTVKSLKAPPPSPLGPGGLPLDANRIGERPEASVELAIRNRAPWAMEAVSMTITWGDRRSPMALAVDHTFEKPLAGGGAGSIRHSGQAMQVAIPIATLREGVNVLSVRFTAAAPVR